MFMPKYATAAVPRYTSYPPATQFGDAVGERDYRQWLAALGADDSLSIYVHIPFCRALCWYCGCHTTVPNREDRIDDYVAALRAEIVRVGALVPRAARVRHVHFGGGTPNALAPAVLAGLIDLLGETLSFEPDAELAVELDPRSVTDGHLAVLASFGRTRASLGVQDVSPEIQALINRHQPFATVVSAVDRLRAAGVGGINLDLMYGLPRQTVAHVRQSARLCAGIRPDRLAVFGYAHVPWFKKHQKAIDDALLPGGAERLQQAEAASNELTRAGYVEIGLDHFARPGDPLQVAQAAGRLQRNFQGYTVDPATTLIGFGASSIGALAGGYVQNEPHLGRYKERLSGGGLPIARGVAVSADDRLIRATIERLMCDFEVDLVGVARGFDQDPAIFDVARHALAPLERDGVVVLDAGVVRATSIGRTYIRNIAACFDRYLQTSGGRHSKAV